MNFDISKLVYWFTESDLETVDEAPRPRTSQFQFTFEDSIASGTYFSCGSVYIAVVAQVLNVEPNWLVSLSGTLLAAV